jgi:hypothetical protein
MGGDHLWEAASAIGEIVGAPMHRGLEISGREAATTTLRSSSALSNPSVRVAPNHCMQPTPAPPRGELASHMGQEARRFCRGLA